MVQMAKSRKEIEYRQRRKYVLECAEKLFAQKGFDGVTVADIAKASEFSVGSLYLFFENKEDLIKQMMLERIEVSLGIVSAEVAKDIPAIEKLENAVGALVDHFVERLDFFKVFVREIKSPELCTPHKMFGDKLAVMFEKFYNDITSIFEQGIREGTFKDNIEPLHMAFFLDACLHTLVEYMLRKDDEIPMDKIRQGMQEMFYHGVLKRERT